MACPLWDLYMATDHAKFACLMVKVLKIEFYFTSPWSLLQLISNSSLLLKQLRMQTR